MRGLEDTVLASAFQKLVAVTIDFVWGVRSLLAVLLILESDLVVTVRLLHGSLCPEIIATAFTSERVASTQSAASRKLAFRLC